METILFSYGTIQGKTIQMELLGLELAFTEDSLTGYVVINDQEIEGKVYPRLGKAKQDIVYGRLYHLTEEQLRILDEYETAVYCRTSIKTDKGVSAQVYVQQDK